MGRVLGKIAGSVPDISAAPKLLAGTGKDDVHLLLVCTGERGLCGPFNSAIVRLARERAIALIGQGKEVKFFCVGRKGYDQIKRTFEKQIIETVELRSVRQIGFVNAEDVAKRVIALYEAGAFDVCTLFFSRFLIGRAAADSHTNYSCGYSCWDERLRLRTSEYEPDEDDILDGLLRWHLRCRLLWRCSALNASFPWGNLAQWTTPAAARSDMIAHACVQPQPGGAIPES
jgi:F-type H+-transporting ATPase subunit gamma